MLYSNFEFMVTPKQQQLSEQLKPYLPTGFEFMVARLLTEFPVKFCITNPRATKLGDYRAPVQGEKFHRITVNGNLNPYSFLITTLHEFAHLKAFVDFGHRIRPHGEEWKQTFRDLLWPAIQTGLLPEEIENALMRSLTNTKASSCSDTNLSRVLRKYDKRPEHHFTLEELPTNAVFELQGKQFRKGETRRTRIMCEEITTRRKYLIHSLATVTVAKDQWN